jgi:hypothetical protein
VAASPFARSGRSLTMFRQSLPFVGWNRALSRRQFLRRTAAGAAAGLAVGSSLFLPGAARAGGRSAPKPIPGGTEVVVGQEMFFIHHYYPGSNDNH